MTNQVAFGKLLHDIIYNNVGDMCDEDKQFNCWYSSHSGSNHWGSWNH
jgi:hypothetical protein